MTQTTEPKTQTCQPEGQEIREETGRGFGGRPGLQSGSGAQGAKPPEAPGFMRILK